MKNLITRILVLITIALIGGIYYVTEIKPFVYEGYENKINEFKKFDAELNEAIVQTQYGIIRNYDSIVSAAKGLDTVLAEFKRTEVLYPNPEIANRIEALEQVTLEKEALTEKFKQYNPIFINAIYNFSTNLSQLIEDQSYDQLIESCLTLDYKFQAVEKARNLFTGMLIYTNVVSESQRLKLKKLVEDIRKEPTDIKRLNLSLIYADVVLDVKPKLNSLNNAILAVPMTEQIDALYDAYEKEYQDYLDSANNYRIILYVLVFALLVLLRWAFKRLENTIVKLHKEVVVRKKAEDELALINKELEQRVEDRTKELRNKNIDLNKALSDLKDAQEQLVMKEKMASVGMLTTGIAHEIKNPLNFVNNFSDLSVELLNDLKEELEIYKKDQSEENSAAIQDIIEDLQMNCQKIHDHGQRADGIVKNMLLHSQESNTQREKTDFNALVEEHTRLAYDAYKAKDKNLSLDIEKTFGADVGKVLLIPQTVGRVVSYIVDNALYTVSQKRIKLPDYTPIIKITTQKTDDFIMLKIWDNGEGIPESSFRKIFEPFYTTKPTGTGTGLGLSICYDTIVKQHDGSIDVDSKEGEYTEFTIKLPISKPQTDT